MAHKSLPISLSLPDGFLSPETRCGYEISSKMKKIWAIELDLLVQFERVCNKYGIKYVALWGTALGAVRHNGFIPWDDDIDVGMDRENYNRFCNVAKNEFCYPYFFQNPYSDRRHFAPLARLRNSRTTAAIQGFDTLDYNNGIYIDIDILDGLARNRYEWRFQNFLKHLVLLPIKMRFPCYNSWLDLYKKIRCIYNGKTSKLGIAYSFLETDRSAFVFQEEYNSSVDRAFEFVDVKVPGNCESYLARTFGDWQQYPGIEDRGLLHHGLVSFNPDEPYVEYIKRRMESHK